MVLVLRTLGYRALWLADRFAGRRVAHEHTQALRVEAWYADPRVHVLRTDFMVGREEVVFDVGGYEGEWLTEMYSRQPCRIEVFEPVKEFATSLAERFQPNDDIRVHGYGLAGSAREVLMSVEGARSSSVTGLRSDRYQYARLRDVVSVLDELAPHGVALMKINIEGGEYEVLERLLAQGRAASVRQFLIQFHDHVADASGRRTAIRHRLAQTHDLLWDFPWIWEAWRRRD
ncbi:MAG TPA: FkbM family methyltransferase [Actinomycetota bacterium]|nr:FkbM family methyltransferase [Actinomycetota bacterium]